MKYITLYNSITEKRIATLLQKIVFDTHYYINQYTKLATDSTSLTYYFLENTTEKIAYFISYKYQGYKRFIDHKYMCVYMRVAYDDTGIS